MFAGNLAVALALSVALTNAAVIPNSTGALLTASGQKVAIPAWDIQSSAKVSGDLSALSKPGLDTSSWHHANSSKGTLMGHLVESGVYNETEIFFSDNLKNIDGSQFAVPWLYRKEFSLDPAAGQHFFVETNGVTSKADIYLNGNQIAGKTLQSGAYAGHTYDVSNITATSNALLIRVYPTNYNYDFALGFVDWNQYPPDNGTGVWRDVNIKQTGAVALGPLRVVTSFAQGIGKGPASVSLKATVQNLQQSAITFTAAATIGPDSEGVPQSWNQSVTLAPLETKDIVLTTSVANPAIWWPKQWGDQPLYNATLSALVNGSLSDVAARKFGFRTVTSQVNSFNDTLFTVNGKAFQVLGGGYNTDLFLRWDNSHFVTQLEYALDLGLNTLRLEGKLEHPEMYEIADERGMMILPGWECCDKWEAWSYNDDLQVKVPWNSDDYATANASMIHEVAMMQTHPSILGYLVGSDYWPDDKAASMYVGAMKAADWSSPIITSAAKAGYAKILGPGGMKMDGPYDWTAPNYWYDTEPYDSRLGAAFGFGSEQSPGSGTPELSSLKKFLSQSDLDDLWKSPNKNLFHSSNSGSSFHNRSILNSAIWKRFGAPTSLEDYVVKAQMADYEATRSEFEGFSAMWNATRPATGVIYWMLNGAWPTLHWAIWDYYMLPGGAYFGTKIGSRLEHVAYDYAHNGVYLINHSRDRSGTRTVAISIVDTTGKVLANSTVSAQTTPSTSKKLSTQLSALNSIKDVAFLKLVLSDDKGKVLSRNVYWLAKSLDNLDWDDSNWFYTPVSKYADYTALNKLSDAELSATVAKGSGSETTVTLENTSSAPAVFISLRLVDASGEDVVPVKWSDNYVTLWPGEKLTLDVDPSLSNQTPSSVQISGKNVAKAEAKLT